MAAYPVIWRIGVNGYTCTMDDGKRLKRAGNGAMHTQQLWEYTYVTITIPHPFITDTQFAELEEFYYEHGRNVQFTDPFEGITYTGELSRPPEEVRRRSAVYLDAMMYFTGRAAND